MEKKIKNKMKKEKKMKNIEEVVFSYDMNFMQHFLYNLNELIHLYVASTFLSFFIVGYLP